MPLFVAAKLFKKSTDEGGGTPINNQDITVTANGEYTADEGYTGLGTVEVNVPTTAPTYYVEKKLDAQGKLINSATNIVINFSGVKNAGDYALYGQYYQNKNITGAISFPDLKYCSGRSAFYSTFNGCTGITSVDLSKLEDGISGENCFNYTFTNCTGITTVNLSNIQGVGNNIFTSAFNGCTNLTNLIIMTSGWASLSGSSAFASAFANCSGLTTVDFVALAGASGTSLFKQTFFNCTSLTTVKLDALEYITGTQAFNSTFQNCTALQSLSFPSLRVMGNATNQFNNIVSGITGCTLHFPSNMQAKIETLIGYPNFGGTGTTVLFDLPATYQLTGANSNKYVRYPKQDTATALAWKGFSDSYPATPYYTSGTTDPQVSDTIYSDSACTVAVTTIDSIA